MSDQVHCLFTGSGSSSSSFYYLPMSESWPELELELMPVSASLFIFPFWCTNWKSSARRSQNKSGKARKKNPISHFPSILIFSSIRTPNWLKASLISLKLVVNLSEQTICGAGGKAGKWESGKQMGKRLFKSIIMCALGKVTASCAAVLRVLFGT